MPGWNMPAGCTENDPYFNDESEPSDVEAHELECGCVEYSDGDKAMCAEHDAAWQARQGFPYRNTQRKEAA